MTFRDYNSILEYCLCYPSFAWCTHRIIALDVFFFMDICLCFMIWCVVLSTWGVFSLAHCGLEAWPIMGDIEPISLGSEIWLRGFEIVIHIFFWSEQYLVHFPHLDFALTYIHPLWALHSITLETIIWPFHPFPALHLPSLIRLGRVWGVWAQGWSCMERVGLWYLGGLRYEDWSIAWWDCHLSCREYRDWYCMMRVGLWWAVLLDEITVYFAFGVRLVHDSRGLTWLYQIDIGL